jgi:hypothetical protein
MGESYFILGISQAICVTDWHTLYCAGCRVASLGSLRENNVLADPVCYRTVLVVQPTVSNDLNTCSEIKDMVFNSLALEMDI